MCFRQIEVTKEKLGTGAVLYYGKVWSSYFYGSTTEWGGYPNEA